MDLIRTGKNTVKVIATVIMTAIGIEVTSAGGRMLYDDIEYMSGNAKPDIYCEVGVFGRKKYYAEDKYSPNIARVKYNKKTKEFKPFNSKQPKIKNLNKV